MNEGRKRTPMPIREREEMSRGSGPVISYKLSEEELEEYRRKTGYKPKEVTTMSKLTKEQYLQLRLAGKGRTEIMKECFNKNPQAFYRQLREWGIKEKDVEERELDLLHPAKVEESQMPVAQEPVILLETEKIDTPSSLAAEIERLIKQHSQGSNTTAKIKQWATERNLHTADPAKQMLKLGEEYGELCQGMAKGNNDQIIDSIGDMYVVLTVLSLQLGLDIESCIDQAYEEIKDRKGKMVNGVFVKESDLGA